MDGKIMAIAITLIVAVPMLLGYALAFEEREVTGYDTTDTVNVTDMTLNSTRPVYGVSYSPLNNQQLRASVHWINENVTETSIISPGFNAQVANGSIPIIAYGGYTQNLTAMSSTLNQSTLTITDPGTNAYVGLDPVNSAYPASFELDGAPYGDPLAAGQTVEFCATGDGTEWTVYYNGQRTGSTIESYGTASAPVNVQTRPYTTLSPVDMDADPVTTYQLTIPCTASVKLTFSDSSSESFYTSANTYIMRSGSTVTIGNTAYDNVDSVAIATAYGTDSVTCMYSYDTGDYADPAQGWTLTADHGIINMPAYWFNMSLNKSVTMMMDIPAGTSSVITPGASLNGAYSVTVARDAGGLVTVANTYTTETLGNYQYLAVTVTGSEITVSGIASWPNMRTNPVLINTVSVPTNSTMENFAGIWINSPTTISYRVDSATIYTGTFPITENYTLDMGDYWPGSDYSVKLSSIGIYGDSITFAGQNYAVNDGAITLNGSDVRLLETVFSSVYDSDNSVWSNRINGQEVSTSATASTIYMGGEWSATLTAYRMQEVTKTSLEWQAGEFAFNGFDNEFALMGLLACVGVFIALGLYGRRSGAKVGSLMLVCACAGFVFLAMI